MIPQVIHYCWFGGKKKSKLISDCINSWKYHLPDYEIIEWNKKNSDLSHPFVKKAYKLKKWAFVSDFIRLKVLYDFGGVYLDTDMMVLKPFDELLTNECFLGAESEDFISCGIIGVVKNNKFIKECLLKYNFIEINKGINWGLITIPRIITDVFKYNNNFYLPFDKIIERKGVVIYPFDYFYPLDYENKDDLENYKNYLSTNSFAVHLWNSSWIQYSEFYYLRNGEYSKGFGIVWSDLFSKKNINIKYFKNIVSCIKESLSKNE